MENEFVRWLRDVTAALPQVELGIGDDGAFLGNLPDGIVVTTDMLMDGVDFRLSECDPERVGRKSLAVNLSDLAAMATVPLAAFVSLALPRSGGRKLAEHLYRGIIALAQEFGVAIAGGDTNSWDGPLVVNVTALGRPGINGLLRRDGARPGDVLLVSGQLGGSILGHHLDFCPRVNEALELMRQFELHAGMDISDGLALDLSRLCEASRCGAVLQASEIPIADAARTISQSGSGKSPLQHALSDGEDFELLLAVPAETAAEITAAPILGIRFTAIGAIVAAPGMTLLNSDGTRSPLSPVGFEHEFT